jgi:lysophospholipase L1-like esterase
VRILDVGLALASLAVSIVAAEGVARIVDGRPPSLPLPQVRYRPDAVRTFTLRAPQSGFTLEAPEHVDSSGFRTNGSSCDRRDGTVVLALGDSFTFGLGVSDSSTWPAQLEEDLRRRGDSACVVNGGTVSYGVFQEMDLLVKRGLATRPRLVIHALSWNDYQSAFPPRPGGRPVLTHDGYFKWDFPPPPKTVYGKAKAWLLQHSTLATLLRGVVHRVEQEELAGGYGAAYARLLAGRLSPNQWAPVRSFYQRLRQLQDQDHFRVLVVILPVSGIMQSGDPLDHPYRLRMRAMLDSLHLAYVDAFDVWYHSGLGERMFLNRGPDAHPSALGYRVLAGVIADTVLSDSMLSTLQSRSARSRKQLGGGAQAAAPDRRVGGPSTEPHGKGW